MARKTRARHGKVTIGDREREFIERLKQHEHEPGSAEAQAWAMYVKVSEDEAVAEARLDALYDKIKDLSLIPDKLRVEFDKLLKARDQQARRTFQTLLAYQTLLNNVFTVPEKEVRQLVLDALIANAEAVTTSEGEIGLDRHRMLVRIADQVVDELKISKVKVREQEQEAPMCADCTAELAA